MFPHHLPAFAGDKRLMSYAHPLPEVGKTLTRVFDSVHWSPPGALAGLSQSAGSSCALATLTEDHWLRLHAPAADGTWPVAADVSRALHQRVKPRPDSVPAAATAAETMERLKRCSDAVAIVTVWWGELSGVRSLLITGQKDQRLALWAVGAETADLDLLSLVHLEGLPSTCKVHKVEEHREGRRRRV